MSETVVILVNGEVLANGHGAKISDQRRSAGDLAEALAPLITSDMKIVVMHGNKPQVGFVLFRSELASHALHTIPLDVCGADTQGATGYMLSQAFLNVLRRQNNPRRVTSILTQTLVDSSVLGKETRIAIGPWFDRDKAEQHRQTRKWEMVEEPGRGYRRAVPSLPALEILEIEGIQHLVDEGYIVIAGGGGGIPVARNAQGDLEGIEAVVETEPLACMMAKQLRANILIMVVESDDKFILSGLSVESPTDLSLAELDNILERSKFSSRSVLGKLRAASEFLHAGGEQVVITTLRKLPEAIAKRGGLRIGIHHPSAEASEKY